MPEEGIVHVHVVPQRVYAAFDGVAPQWRFVLAAVNAGVKALNLERVLITLDRQAGRERRVQSGDRIRGIIQGSRRTANGQVVALDIKDSYVAKPPPQAVEVELTFFDDAGHLVKASRRVALEPRDTAYLSFPLPGRWSVANARTFMHSLGRQFGFDLITPKDMAFSRRPPKRNLDLAEFTSYGQPVFAPASGRVVACADGRPDRPPTPGKASFDGLSAPVQLDEYCGNYVIVLTPSGDHVNMAHFRRGSLRLKVGDMVREGEPIAEVGNSGNTSQPHLHIEVLDGLPDFPKLRTPDFAQSGLPFGFKEVIREYQAEKTFVRQVVPRRMDILSKP